MNRKHFQVRSIVHNIRRTMFASMLVATMGVSAGDGSAIYISSDSISAAATVADVSAMELRVSGPGGFSDSLQSQTGALDWYPGLLADGEYRYEVFVTVGDEPEEDATDNTQLYRENGRFIINNGVLSPLEDAAAPSLENPEGQSSLDISSWAETIASNVLDFLVSPAAAADVTTSPGDVYITDTTPLIYWNDTSFSNDFDWYTRGWSNAYSLWDVTNGREVFRFTKNTPFALREDVAQFSVYNATATGNSISIDENSGENVLNADSNGDIGLADDTVFIDKSANRLGIGTITPSYSVHMTSTMPGIYFDDTIGGDLRISNNSGEVSFYISNSSNNGEILTLENDLDSAQFLYPGLGIWETNPEVPLHVRSHDGMSGGLLVENNVPPTAAGDVSMFELRNQGDKIVRFLINAGGNGWTFDNEPAYNAAAGVNSGRFRVAKMGTGVVEFSVDGYGDGRFYGRSYATSHVNTSSRESKTDFKALSESDVLAKLMQLDISEWRYKQEDAETRHIGPVAEDFQKTFGLGDGKHINTVDSEGIALAAIKATKAEKDAEIAALTKENQELSEKMTAMSERLQALEELLVGQSEVSSR